ncbi:hypothetical protein ACTOS9_22045 (plasmid) [Bacillus subtilis]|uniref:Uncharacterized protein n=1 Tax=Bacillus subtilis TaxID=1423 RepID=A0A8I1WG50_BACIU|nr:hypothetical protein [Bacillus subtilis]MBO3796481.1 hypothetical protein [Bacillus subtilis]MCM3191261.1 hypothetical protein [Bacillus subtilis]WEY82925.1 hypothetical protein P5633_00245 [Bacillus subtilis]
MKIENIDLCKKAIIFEIQDSFQRTGKLPQKSQFKKVWKIEEVFGSWTEALIEAGFFRKTLLSEEQKEYIKQTIKQLNTFYRRDLKKNVSPPPEIETMVLAFAAVEAMRKTPSYPYTTRELRELLEKKVGSAPAFMSQIYPCMRGIDRRISNPRKGCYVLY